MEAKANHSYIPVVYAATCEGTQTVAVVCADYDYYRTLPGAVEFEGRIHGRTGWDSDKRLAYFKSNVPVARKV